MKRSFELGSILLFGCLLAVSASARPMDTAVPARGLASDAQTSPSSGVVRLAQEAPKKCRRRRGTFHFQFEEAGIYDVLKTISVLTCKNFIVSEGVKGGKKELTIISRTPVNVDQAYAAFLAALEANNMALVPAGRFLKVVERKDAAKQALPMYERKPDGSYGLVDQGKYISYSDAHVTLVYELKYATKDQVQPLMRNLMSKTGDLQIVGSSLVIITDSASNVRRLMSILDRIDVSGSSNRIHVVDINYAEAQAVAQKLTEIFGDTNVRGGRSGARSKKDAASNPSDEVAIEKMVADERTNKLIIIASVGAFERIKEVIDILDIPSDVSAAGSQVFVHPLANADAAKAANTLSSLAQGSNRNAKSPAKAKKDLNRPASLFEGEVKVTADEATNSLVIIASTRDYRSLKRVIEQLDIRRPQVFVEAAILEVSLNKDRNFGLNAYSGLPVTVPGFEGQGLGFVANEGGQQLITSSAQLLAAQSLFQRLNTNNIDAAQLSAASEAATSLESMLGWIAFHGPPVPGSEEVFGFPVPSFGMVLNALENNANVDVLSTPHIMTTDNEKAEISVGERVPVVRGIAPVGGANSFLGGLQQVAYEDVKLKFAVTPHVNTDGEIRLELEQEVSDIGGQIPVGNGLNQPIITNRSAKTTVVVQDQQTMVIGGLISNRSSDSERKFPILGDVPLLGWLFKTWSDNDSKKNLIIVLTPYIVRSREDFKKIYDRKMQQRRDFVEAYYGATHADYNPYVDYDKKIGPLGKLIQGLDRELQKAENGGPGLPGEVVVTPETDVTPFDVSGDEEDDAKGVGDAPETPQGSTDADGTDENAADQGTADHGAAQPGAAQQGARDAATSENGAER